MPIFAELRAIAPKTFGLADVLRSVASNAQLLAALLPAQAQLGRVVNPTLYTPDKSAQRLRETT